MVGIWKGEIYFIVILWCLAQNIEFINAHNIPKILKGQKSTATNNSSCE